MALRNQRKTNPPERRVYRFTVLEQFAIIFKMHVTRSVIARSEATWQSLNAEIASGLTPSQ